MRDWLTTVVWSDTILFSEGRSALKVSSPFTATNTRSIGGKDSLTSDTRIEALSILYERIDIRNNRSLWVTHCSQWVMAKRGKDRNPIKPEIPVDAVYSKTAFPQSLKCGSSSDKMNMTVSCLRQSSTKIASNPANAHNSNSAHSSLAFFAKAFQEIVN